jgi:hypothetical protein
LFPVRGGFWTKGIHSSFVLFKRTRFAAIFIKGDTFAKYHFSKKQYMPKGVKYGGRKVGTGNKISSELKEVLNEYCLNEFQFLNANIERLTLHERIILFTKVLPFVLPKNEVPGANTGEAAKVPIIIFSDKK